MWSFSEDGKLCIWSSSVYEIIKEQFIFNETMQLDIQCTFVPPDRVFKNQQASATPKLAWITSSKENKILLWNTEVLFIIFIFFFWFFFNSIAKLNSDL